MECLSLQNVPYHFRMQGTLSGRCNTARRQNETSFQSKVLFLFVHALLRRHAALKQTPPYRWAWHNRSKLNSILFDIHWLHTIFHSKNGCLIANFYPSDVPSWLTGLLSGPCSLFCLMYKQVWICTVYTWKRLMLQITSVDCMVKFSFSKNFISAAVCTLHFLLCMWTHARGMFHLEQQCLSTCVASCEEMCKLFMSVSVSWYYLFNIIIYKHVILHEFAFIIAKDDLWYHNVKKIPSSQNPLVHKML